MLKFEWILYFKKKRREQYRQKKWKALAWFKALKRQEMLKR